MTDSPLPAVAKLEILRARLLQIESEKYQAQLLVEQLEAAASTVRREMQQLDGGSSREGADLP